MKTVVVSHYHHRQELAWFEVSLVEARKILSTACAPGFRYSLPLWQFDDTGSTPESALQERCRAAYREILATEGRGHP